MSDLTPNIRPKVFPYLTICPHRSPVQKLHTAIGHAKNAFQNPYSYNTNRVGTMWQMVDGEWELLYTVEREGKLPWNT